MELTALVVEAICCGSSQTRVNNRQRWTVAACVGVLVPSFSCCVRINLLSLELKYNFFCLQAIETLMASPRISDIITKYDGSTDFSEWVKKLELVAKLQKITELENFLPLFLVGDAFAVYDALADGVKTKYDDLKDHLLKAFSLNSFAAFDRLVLRRYVPGESVDVYLSDLRRLIGLI